MKAIDANRVHVHVLVARLKVRNPAVWIRLKKSKMAAHHCLSRRLYRVRAIGTYRNLLGVVKTAFFMQSILRRDRLGIVGVSQSCTREVRAEWLIYIFI